MSNGSMRVEPSAVSDESPHCHGPRRRCCGITGAPGRSFEEGSESDPGDSPGHKEFSRQTCRHLGWLVCSMALWEYKVITSGKGGFASPALLETFLNQLGTEEWEIIEFRTQPDNPLAFQGLARRPTQRDWTLEAAAAAAARVEADKLRAPLHCRGDARRWSAG